MKHVGVILCAVCLIGCAERSWPGAGDGYDDTSDSGLRAGQTVTITARPKFVPDGRFVDLVMSDAEHTVSVGWGMPPDVWFIPVSLDDEQVYTFTVTQQESHDFSAPKLQRVEQDGRTIYDITVCEVHQVKMAYRNVPIVYGLIGPEPGDPTAEEAKRLFPHRHEVAFGGCVITPDSPKREHIYVCPACKQAREEWKRERQASK